MRHALIIPTYGFVTPTNSTLSGGRGTIARIRTAQGLIRRGDIARNCIVPFPQDILPKGDEFNLIGEVTLGENVASYVQTLPEFQGANVMSVPDSSGTFNDTITSLKQIYLTEGNVPVTVHFVSDWSQLGRLWLIWYLGCPDKPVTWRAIFHLVPNFRTMRDIWLHEPGAYLKCLCLSVCRRLVA
jgi:hypothetical protein